MRIRNSVAIFIAIILATGCGRSAAWQTKSAGGAYEVLLVGDIDSMFYKQLSTEIGALPEPEPSFDVSTTDRQHFKWNAKIARNIVVVEVDVQKNKRVAIEYEHNTYAAPQLIITVKAPSVEELHKESKVIGNRLRSLLNAQERRNEANRVRKSRNSEAEGIVREMFGAEILIPAEMKYTKRGKDFLWISDDHATAMGNICIMRGADIDSILKENVKGERDDMYMTITQKEKYDGRTALDSDGIVERGLWEMYGDAMGGPFILRQEGDVSVLAFLFAPNVKKRNKLKQLETIVYSYLTKDNCKQE